MPITDTAYAEMVDLFAHGSGPEAVIRFTPSSISQARASYLLERNQTNSLAPDEVAELEQLGHVMQLVKARARSLVEPASSP